MKKLNKKYLENTNGITLISLVVTIVVLLILVGISISSLAGENRTSYPGWKSKK